MIFAHLIKVRLGALELFLSLLFEHLEVEAKESLHAGRIFKLQILHVCE